MTTVICKCGCGESFMPSKATLWRMKHGIGGFIQGHQGRGARNVNWRGGRFVSADGYIYILMPEHPNALKKGYVGYVAEHRLVMSTHLGRPLLESELVHHKNENKSDNRLSNLELTTRPKHPRQHFIGSKSPTWKGGRRLIVCMTCDKEFLPNDRRNDYGAKYCSRKCFYRRHR